MIDIHSHILPSADDGAQTAEDAVSIACGRSGDHKDPQQSFMSPYDFPILANETENNLKENLKVAEI